MAITKKHACINVKNLDVQCLKWAVLSALTHLKGYKIHHLNKVYEYMKYELEFNLKNSMGSNFPLNQSMYQNLKETIIFN